MGVVLGRDVVGLQGVDQGMRTDNVGGGETFGEPVEHRRQGFESLPGPLLAPTQAG